MHTSELRRAGVQVRDRVAPLRQRSGSDDQAPADLRNPRLSPGDDEPRPVRADQLGDGIAAGEAAPLVGRRGGEQHHELVVVEQIEKLRAQSNGGFGAYLVMTHEWADWAATLHSYELMAERVFPAFQDSTTSLFASAKWAAGERSELGGAQMKSVQNAMAKHAAEVSGQAGS